jgi:hypothetical protein
MYSAETQEEYHLRKAAFEHTVKADLLAALAAKVSGRPTQKPQYTRSDSSRQDNAKTRRLRKRSAARASVQAAKDSAAEAEVRAEQEAAAGVAAGVEEAQADGRRKAGGRRTSPQRLRLLESPEVIMATGGGR